MKNLFILSALILCVLFSACENPINENKIDKSVSIPDTLYFEIHQNYGYCDSTGCHTEDILLIKDTAISNRNYGFYFQTTNDSVYAYNQWLYYSNCYFIYQTTGTYTFSIVIDKCFSVQGSDYQILNLQPNSNYQIQIQ